MSIKKSLTVPIRFVNISLKENEFNSFSAFLNPNLPNTHATALLSMSSGPNIKLLKNPVTAPAIAPTIPSFS